MLRNTLSARALALQAIGPWPGYARHDAGARRAARAEAWGSQRRRFEGGAGAHAAEVWGSRRAWVAGQAWEWERGCGPEAVSGLAVLAFLSGLGRHVTAGKEAGTCKWWPGAECTGWLEWAVGESGGALAQTLSAVAGGAGLRGSPPGYSEALRRAVAAERERLRAGLRAPETV